MQAYETSLSKILREAGCTADGGPYVVRAFIQRLDDTNPDISPFAPDSPEPAKLAAAFLDMEHCPGAEGLTAAEIAKLKEIRDRAPPLAPKP